MSAEEKRKTFSIIRSSLPLVLFSCTQGQIITFALGLQGASDYIADFGALSGLLFSFRFVRYL